MQPAQYFTGHQTADLTEGKIHKITEKNGEVRFVALFPKTWEPIGERGMTPVITGEMNVQFYRVTSWEEHTLRLVDV